MECTQKITSDIYWIGASDRRIALFENIFPLENGVTYNSYVIIDEKIALIDTVDMSVSRQFYENLDAVLSGRKLDYLIVNHMEPDHCANIEEICNRFPHVKIVGNSKTFQMIKQFYSMSIDEKILEVKEGDEICLGKHTLSFLMAPMVHWPEVMFTYEKQADILFSADAFGTFGGYNGNILSEQCDFENLYIDEARRYYSNIVGKFGPQVLAVLKKLDGNIPSTICPLHGPVLKGGDIALMIEKYIKWASYTPEKNGVVIAYASMYGNTENAANKLATLLCEKGIHDIRIFDVSKTHYSYIIAEAFKYSHLVLASPTYNMHIYNTMETLVRDMAALNLQNRKISIIGNGSWAPVAHTQLLDIVKTMKNTEIVGEPLVIRSALTDAQLKDLDILAEEISASINA